MSFGSISMLLWGLVIAVPVILHLLRKRKSRTVSWGAMRFLQAAMVRRAKRFQLWRLLLLMLRIAAIILLVFAVARPLLNDESDGTEAGAVEQRTLHVLVLDASYSMRANGVGGLGGEAGAGSGESRFDVARAATLEVLESSQPGDGFLLAKLEGTTEWIGNGISYRPNEIGAVIEQMQPGEGIADLRGCLVSLERVLEDVKEQGWSGPIRVYLHSDLQPISWEGLRLTEFLSRISRQESPVETKVFVVDCRRQVGAKNIQADELVVSRGGAGAEARIEFRAGQSVVNQENGAASFALAQLIIDGRVEQSQRVEIGESSRIYNWSHRLASGRHVIEVRLAADDAIELDNRVRQVVSQLDEVGVALFSETSEAARYLGLAISAGSGVIGSDAGSPFVVQRYRTSEMASIEIGREVLWVLCDPAPLDAGSQQRLLQHVRQGGGVVWWLGPNWREEAGGLQFQEAPESQWSAASVVSVRGDDDILQIDPFGYEDSIIRPFEPYPGSGLLTLPVFKYWDLKLGNAWNRTLGVAGLKSVNPGNDGMGPLIGKLERVGGGREVIVATPPYPGIRVSRGSEAAGNIADGDEAEPWNAFIAWPAFVPLVQEIFRWAAAGQDLPGSFIVGELIVGSSPEAEMGSLVVGSSGESLDLEITGRFGSRVRWTAGKANRADVYRWADGPSQGEVVFAVNVDIREGDLAGEVALAQPLSVLSGAEMADDLQGLTNSVTAGEEGLIENSANESSLTSASLTESGLEDVGWWLLLAAVGLLLGESALARMLETRF